MSSQEVQSHIYNMSLEFSVWPWEAQGCPSPGEGPDQVLYFKYIRLVSTSLPWDDYLWTMIQKLCN